MVSDNKNSGKKKGNTRKKGKGRGNNMQSAPSRIVAREKERRTLELRRAGTSFTLIAEEVGYADASGAYKAYQRAMERVIQEPREELVRMQIERCNFILMRLWPEVTKGDLSAIREFRATMDKLDSYLGTEAAQEVHHQHDHGGAVLVIKGETTEDYVRGFADMAGVDPEEAVEALPPGIDGDVVDGEVVEQEPAVSQEDDAAYVSGERNEGDVVKEVKGTDGTGRGEPEQDEDGVPYVPLDPDDEDDGYAEDEDD